MSLPTRERGLKLIHTDKVLRQKIVAPYTGAWIETILYRSVFGGRSRSLPTRERGLKHILHILLLHQHLSLPTRERGLKHCQRVRERNRFWSLPTRERGLKQKVH